jgi:trans-aconitate methyltransferase
VVLRDPAFAVQMLEEAIESLYKRMRKAADHDAFVKLANSLAMATTRLVNAHRILALLASGHTSVEEALKELQNLAFEVD